MNAAPRATAGKWLELVARIGFAARGVVHIVVGSFAAAAAFVDGQPADTQGALSSIARSSGPMLIWVLAGGLLAFAVWRLAEALWDPENLSRERSGVAVRTARAGAGLAYLMSAVLAVQSAWLKARPASPGDAAAQSWASWLMALPGGPIMLGLVGAALLAAAATQAFKALRGDFQVLEKATLARAAIRLAGRLGFGTRSLVLAILGWFVLRAAMLHHAREAGGLGHALRSLQGSVLGNTLLFAVASGLAMFGLFSLSEASFFSLSARQDPRRAASVSADRLHRCAG